MTKYVQLGFKTLSVIKQEWSAICRVNVESSSWKKFLIDKNDT